MSHEQSIEDSYSSTKTRFDSESAAATYSRKHDNARDRREQRCIASAMAACELARDSLVLDLPCGAGRLSRMVVDAGHRLVGADSSPHMVGQAVDAWLRQNDQSSQRFDRASFEVRDVMNTGYEDAKFDLIICNRLFHHFTESTTRVQALTELRRVTRRWLIVSFFNANTIDAKWKRFRNFVRIKRPIGRIPIPYGQFEAEAHAAGLKIIRSFPTRGVISPQWYVLLERA